MNGDLSATLSSVGLIETRPAWEEGWDRSQVSYRDERPTFLKPDYVGAACNDIGMSVEIRDVLLAGMARFDNRPDLWRLAWHCHVALFQSDASFEDKSKLAKGWPRIESESQGLPPLFYAYVLLSGVPAIREFHCARGVSETVTRDTLNDLELWIRKGRRRAGFWCLQEMGWCLRHFLGNLYRLGRLQFGFQAFPFDCRAFRHRATRKVVLFAGEGMKFRPDGQFHDAAGATDSSQIWTASFSEDGKIVRGYRFTPDGRAVNAEVALPSAEWEEILRKNDPTLGIHIPEIGPMDHAQCGESMRQALDFFPRHFPEKPYRAFTCMSWLCDRLFSDLLPPESNIRRFQREFYLMPLPGGSEVGMFRQIFGRTFENLDDVPQDSSLLRLIVGHLRAGRTWHNGGAIYFPEDLAWGEEIYRRSRGWHPTS